LVRAHRIFIVSGDQGEILVFSSGLCRARFGRRFVLGGGGLLGEFCGRVGFHISSWARLRRLIRLYDFIAVGAKDSLL
jgi:hypothetical protein